MQKFVDDLKILAPSNGKKTSNTIMLIRNIEIKEFKVHTVNSSERLDIISKDYYGTPDYFWFLALVNNIDDFIIDLKRGQKLIIPDL